MELEELKLNLHALRQLYGLLRKDGNGSPNSTSNLLDDKSRLLLKDLLDRAAENAFKIHSEVLGAQASLSIMERSGKAQQLQATKTSDDLQICGNDQNSLEFTELENGCRFRAPREQRLSVMQPMLSVGTSGLGSRHKYCRFCQRRILRPSMESATLLQQQNCQSNSLSCSEEKETLRAPIRLPESPVIAEESKQRGTTHLYRISSGIGSTDSSGVESGPVGELTEEIALENECLSYLSEQAFDAIKQIEVRILDLDLDCGPEISENNGRSTGISVSCEAQQEVSDVVMEKLLMATRNEPNKSELPAAGVNDSRQEVDNRQRRGTSPLNQLPSMTRSSSMEMELPRLTATSPLMLGKCTGLASEMQLDIRNPCEEIKRQNHMVDWALGQKVKSNVGKFELDYATTGEGLKPSHMHNCYCFSSEDNKIAKRVPTSVACLPHQINRLDLHQNQAVLEQNTAKPGACSSPMQCRKCKNQDTWALDSRHKANQFSRSQSKKGFPGELRKWEPSLQHKADHHYPGMRILQRQHESDASLSSNSSKWKSQQTGMSYGGSEEYYPPRQSQIQRWNYDDSPTASSENDMYSLSDHSPVRYEGVSSSDNEVYSWQSSDDRPYKSTSWSSDERKGNSWPSSASSSQASYSGDGETEGYSSYNQPRFQHGWQPRDFSVGSTSSQKIRPNGVYASSRKTNPGKKIGGWKKLKEKLSIIFHHHHHHHHHLYHQPHTDDDEDLGNWRNRKFYGKLPSKHTAKSSHLFRPDGNDKQALEKIEKAVVHGRDGKKLHKPANALIGGLFRHVRHSKRSKLSAKHIKPSRDRQYDRNNVSAKLNWLNVLRRHRKAKKLGIGYRKR